MVGVLYDGICGTTEYSKSKIGKRSASSGFGEASTRADSDRSWNAIQLMPDYALVLNAGSSSLKFSVYERLDEPDWRLSSRGQIEASKPLHGLPSKTSMEQF